MVSVQCFVKCFLAVPLVLFTAGFLLCVQSCHPNSRELHVCLNIYLEKDLPYIETIIRGQEGRRQGRVLLEDPDLRDICKHVTTLYDCYKGLLGECDTYWQLDRYSRLMNLLDATHTYICSNDTKCIKELLLNTHCLSRVRDLMVNCSSSGFSWLKTWKEILRLRVGPSDRCQAMEAYRTCLLSHSSGEEMCGGHETGRIYGNLIQVWLRSWCGKGETESYFSQTLKYVSSASGDRN